jgi:hypothetical protein
MTFSVRLLSFCASLVKENQPPVDLRLHIEGGTELAVGHLLSVDLHGCASPHGLGRPLGRLLGRLRAENSIQRRGVTGNAVACLKRGS